MKVVQRYWSKTAGWAGSGAFTLEGGSSWTEPRNLSVSLVFGSTFHQFLFYLGIAHLCGVR